MDKPKPTEPQPSLDDIVERLEALESQLEKLQDYTVRHIKDLYESDIDQKQAILNTQKVLAGDLRRRGLLKEPEDADKEFQTPTEENALERMKALRNQALGIQEEDSQSSGSTSGGSQLLRSMKKSGN